MAGVLCRKGVTSGSPNMLITLIEGAVAWKIENDTKQQLKYQKF
tara:strand:+ start:1346 stop:1477 length:132 start_codon:yes stop_codon:yes gene_type:complete